jgi:hypothetical protein
MTVSSSALSLTMGSMGTLSTGFNFGEIEVKVTK